MRPVPFFFACLLLAGGVMPLAGQETFRVMTYNVENLFDCRRDSLKDDAEFQPEGPRRWTPYRYWTKLDALAKVVAAASAERIPDLIGLCEVENDSVLHDLTRRSSLRALGYRYVVSRSPDVRGMNVALLYQPGFFRLLSSREVVVPSAAQGFRPTRNLLYAKGLLLTGDTLHVVMCHLPSRLGRMRASRRHRMLAARTLRALTDSVAAVSAVPNIIVMGDFNAGLKDEIFRSAFPAGAFSASVLPAETEAVFREPSPAGTPKDGAKASYRYQGTWEDIDHIFVSPALLDTAGRIFTAAGRRSLLALPFMCEPEPKYGGLRPLRTYLGPRYLGGVSDHFPVLLDFVLKTE